MNLEQFTALLKKNRAAACKLLADIKVEGWMDDGVEEVKHCLALWMEDGRNLGDEDTLIEIAAGVFD